MKIPGYQKGGEKGRARERKGKITFEKITR